MVAVKIQADANGYIAAATQAQKATDQFKKSFNGAAKEAEAYGRLITRVFRDGVTPLEKYNRSLADLNALLKAGAISESQFNVYAAKLKDTLDKTKVNKDALTIPSSAITSVIQFATAALSVQSAWNQVKSAIEFAAEEARKAGQVQEESKFSRGSLIQVAKNQQDFDKLEQTALSLYGSGATQTQSDAFKAVFALRSAGLDADADTFRKVGEKKIVDDLPTLIQSVAKDQAAFGVKETGNTEAVLSKLFAASEYSPANVNDISTRSANLGAIADALKYSDESAKAHIAVLSKAVGVERAQTRTEAFWRKIDELGLNEGTPEATVAAIESREKRGESASSILGGSAEAIEGYRLAARPDLAVILKEATAVIQQANSGKPLQAKLQMAAANSSVAASEFKDQAINSIDVQRQSLGNMQQMQEGLMAKRDLYEEKFLGQGPFARYFNRKVDSFSWWLGQSTGDGLDSSMASERDFRLIEEQKREAINRGDTEALKYLEDISRGMKLMVDIASQPRREPKLTKPEQ